ncbi:MAG: DinB family protein [Promethearchaeota archaeon]
MRKNEVIEFLRGDHRKLWGIVENLPKSQIEGEAVQGEWNVRDIIAHVTAWHWELIRAVDRLLKNEQPWNFDNGEEEFNRRTIAEKKLAKTDRIMVEWHDAFYALIRRIEDLTDSEWNHALESKWEDGSPISVQSLFDYRYKGEGHEGGHALQIREHYGL